MGTWGYAAWQNDAALDWIDEFFSETKLASQVEKTLNSDPEEYHDEIRAAAYILAALGQDFIWPVNDLQRHLKLAIEKLEAIKELDPNLSDAIDEDLAVLRSRLSTPEG